MTIISTDGHAEIQPQSPLARRGGEQTVAVAFLLTSAVATLVWLYALSEGAVAVAHWLWS